MDEVKSRWLSKISWGGVAISLVGLGVAVGIIPEGMQDEVASAVMTVGGALIVIFRQFYTTKKLE